MVLFSISRQMQKICLSFGLLTISSSLLAFYVDGSGHYGARGVTITDPGAAPDRGTHQAIEQSFQLTGEFRSGESASLFTGFRLFNNPRDAYLGDTAQPNSCNGDPKCIEKNQSTSDPGYQRYTPRVTELYIRYAFEYCIAEVGRRPRDWGLGIFLDSGKRPFSVSNSYFDGVSCNINLQKFQDLGFSFGYDKLAETGNFFDKNTAEKPKTGPSNRNDDIDQIFFSVELDDRKSSPNKFLNKQIGIYAANMKSGPIDRGGNNTELSFADLYLGFYFPRFTIRNEFLFKIGSSADPNAYSLGGAHESKSGDMATNRMNTIALAGSMEWLMVGPRETPEQTYLGSTGTRHITFFEYAIAPGDRQGYFNNTDANAVNSLSKRDENARAIALNANFTPALILFNGRTELDELKVDGIFDPKRVMNAQVYSLGYRLESKDYGNFETKLVTASLSQTPPDEVKEFYATVDKNTRRPIGFYGKSLGYELDLKYWKTLAGGVEAGLATGLLLPGKAWQVREGDKPRNSFLFQAHLVYKF